MDRNFRFAQRVVFCLGSLPWLGLSILAVLTLSSALLSQTSQDSNAVVHLPTDWSHHHLVFSTPAAPEQLERIQQDPRYWQQLLRRSHAARPEAELGGAVTSEVQSGSKAVSKNPRLKRDWSLNMGSGATVGAGQYPGFYLGSSNCSDFAVFNTSLAGSATQASIIAYNNVYSGCTATPLRVLGVQHERRHNQHFGDTFLRWLSSGFRASAGWRCETRAAEVGAKRRKHG
ncbi:MAG: hypothetical protein WA383_08635 [Terriglobales bacterium]|jgi:hypothetical protein